MNSSDPALQEKIFNLTTNVEPKEGRTIETLLPSYDRLAGDEALRMRRWSNAQHLDPSHDLDEYGRSLFDGDLARVKANWYTQLARFLPKTNSEETARVAAAQEVYLRHWSSTHVPIFQLLLIARHMNPSAREDHLSIARWLIAEVKLPVDGTDVAGTSALAHALSTRPCFDPEFAQILYDAGGDVNHRNRYGATAAHEITLIQEPQDKEAVQRSADALAWYLSHGGNIDIRDNDGLTARMCVDSTRKLAEDGFRLPTWELVDREDSRRRKLGNNICTFCGREPEGRDYLLVCSRCGMATYCPPPRHCQRGDWPRHRLTCKTHEPKQQGTKYLGVHLDKHYPDRPTCTGTSTQGSIQTKIVARALGGLCIWLGGFVYVITIVAAIVMQYLPVGLEA